MSLICIPKLCNISDGSILLLLLLLDLENYKIHQQRELTLGKKGYVKGPPDIMIMNYHPLYSGFCLEFKSPTNNYHTSDAQKEMKKQYKSNNYYFKISNDHDLIIKRLSKYMERVRVPCKHCEKSFLSKEALQTHLKIIHRINII